MPRGREMKITARFSYRMEDGSVKPESEMTASELEERHQKYVNKVAPIIIGSNKSNTNKTSTV